MPRHKSMLANFVIYSALLMLVLLIGGQAAAQSAIESVDKGRVQTTPAEPADTTPLAVNSTTDRTKASPDPVKAEAALMNAAADTKGQPGTTPAPPPPAQCKRTIKADVVAIAQPIMLNRLGAAIPSGMIFALKRDTVNQKGTQLRADKRPRPLVLRANVGDCLTITLTNNIPANNFKAPQPGDVPPPPNSPYALDPGATSEVSLHVQGMEWVNGPQDDGSFVGKNNSSLAAPGTTQTYTLFAREEGTFLLYTMGDTTSTANQLTEGLFGAVNVEPFGAEWYRSQVTQQDLKRVTKALSPDGHPQIDYTKVYPPGATYPDGKPIPANTPVLNMLDATNTIVHTDLTAIITGPKAGRFPGANGNPNKPEPPCNAENNPALNPPPGVVVDPLFCQNPAAPDRKQPYREFTIIYHGGLTPVAAQAFPVFTDPTMQNMLVAGQDAFAINYGTGGIGAEVYANRIGVGPMGNCVDCKFEEFFLSAWSVGDPAMLVDLPANVNIKPPLPPTPAQPPLPPPPPLCTAAQLGSPPDPNCANARVPAPPAVPYTLAGLAKATRAYYADDPSNVYHSYINDHLKFRILHGGRDVSHVHHQHAHQWLQSPNSDEGSYLDSQMISPGASYTLEMTYNGSGNRNKVVGDSIFHCHFYPHFAAGMWAMWRTHDVFESGTELKNGIPVSDARALPDGEIMAGTPIPALVPLPTIAMAPLPSPVFISSGQIVYGTPGSPDPTGKSVTVNPGFPFFIPGRAGDRAPHPPLDFAPDGAGGYLDGGLPRHIVTGGTISNESHDTLDWSKDLATMIAIQLPEEGTNVEQVAMKFFGKRCYATFFPDGTPGSCPSSNSTAPQSTMNTPPTGFILNGLPRKNPAGNSAEQLGATPGAPFADPAIDDNGNPVGTLRRYQAAAIQLDVTFNKKGWHYPQQRILTLWKDVANTLNYVSPYSWNFDPAKPAIKNSRQPEPLFFRGNSGDIIEYWHTNLVPNYYLVDDFQVRTPTDILGQHIHLVKFDVTSSDGAGNGFNYEDGTFSPEEVQEIHTALTAPGGSWTACAGCTSTLRAPQPPPAGICPVPNPPAQCTTDWMGAQTTIQRWYIDPLVDDAGVDRTMRTVFTHDHFGPSTHQQAGLYAGLLIEPQGSKWTSNNGVDTFGTRSDGGPTSWQARIITSNSKDSYREFMLEFQDLQLAYWSRYPPILTKANPDPKKGWRDWQNAINPPGGGSEKLPSLITTGVNITPAGTQSVNYTNEPIATRLGSFGQFPNQKFSDLSYVFDNSIQPTVNPSVGSWDKPDPLTPLMRAYQNDKVQLRVLVGAHVFSHQFNLAGPTWFAEPAWKNSGYRSAQAMGLSEHFELLFNVPSSSAPTTKRKCPDGRSNVNCVDYLYSPSFDESGLANGLWGLFRSYDPTASATDPILKTIMPLPNNPISPAVNVTYATCPANAPQRTFNLTAVTSQQALASQSPFPRSIVFNGRGPGADTLANTNGIMYVRTEDLFGPADPKKGQLKPGVPVEPLILRANAGDCINVNLTNAIAKNSDVLKASFKLAPPLDNPPYPTKVSSFVGLRPQLLSYDAAKSSGINIGWNSQGLANQVAPFGTINPIKYQWYAGKIDRTGANGSLTYTPVEFGSLNLFPSDTMFQNINGLFGSMIIEPKGSTWTCGELGAPANCDPSAALPATTRASATVTLADKTTTFREFSVMISDAIQITPNVSGSAVNYRTEPFDFRYADNGTLDFSCMLSNQLFQVLPAPSTPMGDPKTPIFSAKAGDRVRFRMTHPFGTGTSQVFTVHGHVWQRNPYQNNSQAIGDNKLSQWLGSRDNHGSSDHFDLVIDKAGGEGKQAGDYLYSVFQFLQVSQGAWGIFRVVGPLGPAQPAPAACRPPPTPKPGPKPVPAGRDGLMIRRPLNGKP